MIYFIYSLGIFVRSLSNSTHAEGNFAFLTDLEELLMDS